MSEQLTMIVTADLAWTSRPSSERQQLSRVPAARLLRDLLRGGMPVELVPYAARLVVELEQIAIEQREYEEEVA